MKDQTFEKSLSVYTNRALARYEKHPAFGKELEKKQGLKAFAHAVGVSNAAGGLGGAVRFSVHFGSKTQ